MKLRGLGVFVLAMLAIASCYNRREVARADWPAISPGGQISVRTLEGHRHSFRVFAFTQNGLVGREQPWASNAPLPDSVIIPLDSIAAVTVVQLDRKRTALLLAAATTVAFVVIAEAQSDDRPQAQPRPPSTSCPFIYSFDGKNYVFDSETYAGAIARGLERTDVDNLDHLRAVDGKYRLRFTNERPETHYTDELNLLVADHPAGTRLYPEASGVLHVVGQGNTTLSVREYGGDTIPSRAGWDLAFVRPPGDSVALVLTTRNTVIAPFILANVLSLLGTEVYSWYASLGSNLMARGFVRAWIEREGYLEIQTQAAETWRTVAKLPDVGPAIAKSNVVVLRLPGAVGDTVRLRLESSPGLWLLERAELSEYRGKTDAVTLRPARAVDEQGKDVSARLAARDMSYLVTLAGSAIEMEFAAPPRAVGMKRTVFARTTGHYYIHGDDTRPPRRDVVMKLMSDRAFAQQYFETEWRKAGGETLVRKR